MKIGVKVTILIVIAVVGLAIVGVFGIRGIDGLNNMINYIGEVPVRNSNLANEVMEHFSVVRANTAMMIIDANNPESLKADLEKIEEAAGDMYAILDTLHNSASEQGKVFIKKIQDAVLESGHERKAMTDMVIAGDVAGASVIRSTTYARDAGAVTDAIDKYVTFASAQVHQAVEIDSTELAASTQMTMYIVIALVLVILIVVAVIVIRGITKGLKQAVEAVRKISEGDFDVDLETTSKDEIGILMDSSKDMVNAIKTCISAAEHIAKNVENGKLDSRADTKLVKGAYADMLSGVNGLIEAFYVPLQIIVVFVRDISNGIVPPKITNDFRGEFGELEIDMNNCIDTLAYIVTNVNRIGAEAREGILEHRVDVTKLQNAWNELVSGVNGILENADNIINDAGKTLSTMATGDLTPRITAAYKGKFGEMKDNINNLGDSLTDL
ncbi:MAG: HAMP domain-containing protein, partial [Ignavibacteria bacterium]|nr:HAMP domain-containing protein [Ignavibacteria bacterium]